MGQAPLTAAPGPGGAGKAMLAHHDRCAGQLSGRYLADVMTGPDDGEVQHMVEVAIIDASLPVDADQVTAHDFPQVGGIEVVF